MSRVFSFELFEHAEQHRASITPVSVELHLYQNSGPNMYSVNFKQASSFHKFCNSIAIDERNKTLNDFLGEVSHIVGRVLEK